MTLQKPLDEAISTSSFEIVEFLVRMGAKTHLTYEETLDYWRYKYGSVSLPKEYLNVLFTYQGVIAER